VSDPPDGWADEATANAVHQMELVRRDSREGDEWHCPTCGRRIVLRMPPHYTRRVVEAGDEQAMHAGMKGMTTIQPAVDEWAAVVDSEVDDWRSWLEDGGLEDWLRDRRP
jgi:hypothetical protein